MSKMYICDITFRSEAYVFVALFLLCLYFPSYFFLLEIALNVDMQWF